MSSLFLNIPALPRQAAFRSYLKGYAINAQFTSGPILTDNTLDYTDQFGIVFHIELHPHLAAWSSVAFTVDAMIDIPHSHCYIGTTEVIDGVFSRIDHIINEAGWYLILESGGGVGTLVRHVLPAAPPGYWRPSG